MTRSPDSVHTMGTIALVGLLIVLSSPPSWGQGPTREQFAVSFEVASVKANMGRPGPNFIRATPGALFVTNSELRFIIQKAYGIESHFLRFKLIGGSDRILHTRFDIQAKVPEGTPAEQIPLMLRSLLAERFKLRIHSEVRPTPVYALTVLHDGKLGPDFRPSSHDCDAIFSALRAQRKTPSDGIASPRDARNRPLCWYRQTEDPTPPGAWRARSAGSLARLIADTQAFVDRPIVDATGLAGKFEWQLEFNPFPPRDSEFPPIYNAFEQQLGLRLQPRTAAFESFVIDSVDLPTPN